MSFTANLPTPHPEVNDVLRELLEGVRTILGEHLVGAYLFGSLTSGDFDRDSDIDVVVVTDEEISGEQFSALAALHERLAVGGSWWATQLEVSYVPRRAIRRLDPNDALHPHIDRGGGESLRMTRHDSDWVVQRHALREHGITLAGPAPQTLIDPVSPDDLRRAMLDIMWWPAQILDDPARISKRGYQSYIVLTMCRVLYTLQNGAVVSKRAAADWAKVSLGERWAPLIERAWAGRRQPDLEAAPEDVDGTLDLIRHTIERSQQFETPADELKG